MCRERTGEADEVYGFMERYADLITEEMKLYKGSEPDPDKAVNRILKGETECLIKKKQ